MSITATVARALGRTMIQSLIPDITGVNAIIRAVRKAGYGYRRETMLDDIRGFQGRIKNEYWIRQIRPGDTIPRGLMVPEYLKQPVKYRVYGETTFYNPGTDSYRFGIRSMHTDRLLSTDQWEEEFIGRTRERYPDSEEEVISFKTIAVDHHIGYDY